jgi:hypothetical protein
VIVRCQLLTEDMDELVSVTSDGDLASVLDEYEYYDVAASRHNRQLRMIRVFLHPPALARTPRVSSTPLLASRRCRPPGYALMHATVAGPSRQCASFCCLRLRPSLRLRPDLSSSASAKMTSSIGTAAHEEHKTCSRINTSYVCSLCYVFT